MIWFLAGLLLASVATFWLIYKTQRQVDDRMIAVLEFERDLARNEAKVYRNLLFPVLTRGEENQAPAPATSAPLPARAAAGQAPKARPPLRRRVPFRELFNTVRAQTNAEQQKHDALVQALKQQKVPTEEKTTNVEA